VNRHADEASFVNPQNPQTQPWWKRECGPLKSFVIGGVLGAATWIAILLFLQENGKSFAVFGLFCTITVGLLGSALSFMNRYPDRAEALQPMWGAILLAALVVAVELGWWRRVVNLGWIPLLVAVGGLSCILYLAVFGIAGLVVDIRRLLSRGPAEHEDAP
jgi:hypothetical protein